jgi:hypothetical protein
MSTTNSPEILHLHTYFLFPFSIDKKVVTENHGPLWSRFQHWIDGLDHWIGAHPTDSSPVSKRLGPWRRAAYSRFDFNSAAYQDMVFFHPIVRRVFFDTTDVLGVEKESLLRCYNIPLGGEKGRLWLVAQDRKQRSAEVEVTDLRLFLFANGIGILSIGVEAFHLSTAQALWINESLRKVYPSSGRQVREGRIPNRVALALERDGQKEVIVEEDFSEGTMSGFLPPLSRTITSLVYFADYAEQEFEPVLDERMIVYTYAALDPATMPEGYIESEEYQVLLSRFLYVDLYGAGYRYELDFTRTQMRDHVYRRWAHQGTYYGFTSYSNATLTVGTFDCDEHTLLEGFLIHRMFDSRYYLMALVALFYRATLLDFAERSALVSKRLFLDQEDGRFTQDNIRLAIDVRAEFLHFSNYWYFDELANKDEEIEHFDLQCRQFRIDLLKREVEEEIEKLNASLHDYSAFRNTEAVNRLAMLSLIVGAGAVLTGFFGMNFGRNFARWFFEPDPQSVVIHYFAVSMVALLALGALAFGFYMVAANWSDYRDILVPGRGKRRRDARGSLRRE